MRKAIAIIALVAMILSLVGCGNNMEPTIDVVVETPSPTPEPTPEPVKVWNVHVSGSDYAEIGLEKVVINPQSVPDTTESPEATVEPESPTDVTIKYEVEAIFAKEGGNTAAGIYNGSVLVKMEIDASAIAEQLNNIEINGIKKVEPTPTPKAKSKSKATPTPTPTPTPIDVEKYKETVYILSETFEIDFAEFFLDNSTDFVRRDQEISSNELYGFDFKPVVAEVENTPEPTATPKVKKKDKKVEEKIETYTIIKYDDGNKLSVDSPKLNGVIKDLKWGCNDIDRLKRASELIELISIVYSTESNKALHMEHYNTLIGKIEEAEPTPSPTPAPSNNDGDKKAGTDGEVVVNPSATPAATVTPSNDGKIVASAGEITLPSDLLAYPGNMMLVQLDDGNVDVFISGLALMSGQRAFGGTIEEGYELTVETLTLPGVTGNSTFAAANYYPGWPVSGRLSYVPAIRIGTASDVYNKENMETVEVDGITDEQFDSYVKTLIDSGFSVKQEQTDLTGVGVGRVFTAYNQEGLMVTVNINKEKLTVSAKG